MNGVDPGKNGKVQKGMPKAGIAEKRKVMVTTKRITESITDYSEYTMSGKEYAAALLKYALLNFSVSFLFFNSMTVFLILMPGVVWFFRGERESLRRKRIGQLKKQFLDGIELVSSSLQAGYSVENAFREAEGELKKIYPAGAYIRTEFRLITAQLEVNRSIEQLLTDFGKRSGIEDIISFAEVFQTAKRTGGDLMSVIRNTASCIRQKQETLQEIETCLSGKIMEQNVMSAVPMMILAYVRLTSPEFLAGMYGNPTGIAVMSACLAVYALAFAWGRRIVRIEV